MVAWFENQDGAATLQPLAAIAETLSPLFQRDSSGDFYRVPGELPGVAFVFAGIDATVQPRCRIVAPSLRDTYKRSAIEVPKLSSTVEPGSPPVVNDFRREPIRLRPGELVGYETVNNPAAATDQFIVTQFCDGPVQAVDPKGGFWIRTVTAAAAMNANDWNNRALTPDESLLEGVYDVLAAFPISTSGIAMRLAFAGQTHRPGVLCYDTRTDVAHAMFEPGQLGVLGRFSTQVMPTADFLVDAADNEVQIVDLYVRPVNTKV
jgi:hypothetical protein